jgi:hypothetical protein
MGTVWNNAERPFSAWNSSRREEMKISAAIAASSNKRVNADPPEVGGVFRSAVSIKDVATEISVQFVRRPGYPERSARKRVSSEFILSLLR